MDLLNLFKNYLFSQKPPASRLTVKNYAADIARFIRWYETEFQKPFDPSFFTNHTLEAFKKAKTAEGLSGRSLERHLSSLRKFSQFLLSAKMLYQNPFESQIPEAPTDNWHLKAFKSHLYDTKASNLTIKNYIMDVRQFLDWASRVGTSENEWEIKKDIFTSLDSSLVAEYRDRLLHEAKLSPVSINRKLSSLRRYFAFLLQKGVLRQNPLGNIPLMIANQPQNELTGAQQEDLINQENDLLKTAEPEQDNPLQPEENRKKSEYSAIPPIRLSQKLIKTSSWLLDQIANVLATALEQGQYLTWKLTGAKVFTEIETAKTSVNLFSKLASKLPIPSYLRLAKLKSTFSSLPKTSTNPQAQALSITGGNLAKAFYAPHKISLKSLPLHKKIWHHARYTRPKWYKTYHSYSITHYFHFAILIIFMTTVGMGLYQSFFEPGRQGKAFAALPTAPPRILSFQGRLTDNSDNPITATTNLRFAIYNDATASGSALLWQEVKTTTPDTDGIFNVYLGQGTAIPDSVFFQNSSLYLGITVGSDTELTPRQQIATVAYAANSETLQGLKPITAAGAGTTNVVLALDSSGNLSIGGTANPVFQATGGKFTVSGQPLLLTTNTGSNGNIQLVPDGLGKIDLQKALVNSSLNGPLPSAAGAVQVDDLFAVNATSSGQSAFTLNQDGAGPLLSASSSGVAKFTVANTGDLTMAGNLTSNGTGNNYFAGNVGIGTTAPGSLLEVAGSSTSGINIRTNNSNASGYSGLQFYEGATQKFGFVVTNSAGSGYVGGANAVQVWNYGSGPMIFATNNTEKARFIASGDYLQFATGGYVGSDGTNLVLQPSASSANVVVYNNTGSSQLLTIQNAGNIGVGTANPASFKLQVAGSVGPDATNTYDLGSSALQWRNINGQNYYQNGTLLDVTNYWQRNLGAVSPKNITDDLLLGATASNAAKFGFLNVASGNPTATISGNLSLVVPTTAGTNTLNLLNNSSLNIQTSVGGDAGLSTALFVNKGGNVGIGTTNPNQKLSIQGNTNGNPQLRLTSIQAGASNQYADLIFNDTGDNYLNILTGYSAGTNNYISFSPAAAEKMRIQQNGNVGIGTTSPIGLFNVVGAPAGQALVNLNYTGTDQNIFTASASGTTKFTIANNGYVGMNTASPSYPLDITSSPTGGISYITLNINDTSNNAAYHHPISALSSALPTGNVTSLEIGTARSTNNLGYIGFQNNGAGSSTNFLTLGIYGADKLVNLLPSGSVGIGTTTPTAFKLQVAGSVGPDATNTYDLGSSALQWRNVYAQNFYQNGNLLDVVNYWQRNLGAVSPKNITDDLLLGSTATASALIKLGGTTNANSYFNTGGNVGIGTTSPTSPLHVAGAYGGNAAAIINQLNSGDIFTASASGITKFTIANNGNLTATGTLTGLTGLTSSGTITFSAFSTNGGLIYTNASGTLAQTTAGTLNQCLISQGGGSPTWGTCGSGGGSSYWNQAQGALFPNNSTVDLLVGGQASSSAKFAVLNLNSGTPTASVSATATGTGLSLAGNGTIQSLLNSTLTLGGTTTGNIAFSPNNTSTLVLAPNSVTLPGATTFSTGTGNVSINGQIATNLVPSAADTYNLGSASNEWNNLYVRQIITPSTGGIAGYWQLNSGVLSPTNITNDLTLGGTATSSALFQVFGSGTNGGTATTSGNLVFRGTTPQINSLNGGGLNFQTSLTGDAGLLTRLFIAGSGNIGVGTSTPSTLFNVAGNANIDGNMILRVTGDAGTAQRGIEILPANSASNQYIRGWGNVGGALNLVGANTSTGNDTAQITLNPNGGYISFSTNSGISAYERMRIDSVGHVGIGTISPNEALTVAGNASISANLTFYGTTSTIANTSMNTLTIGDSKTGNLNLTSGSSVINLNGLSYLNQGAQIASGYNLTVLGNVGSHLIPSSTDLYNLGSATNEWNNLYVRQIITPSTGGIAGYWQLNSGVLSPANITNDLSVGGTATSSALFQVFATGTNAGSASTSGNLTFRGTTSSINQLNGNSLTFQTSPGGDAGLSPRVTILNNGNVGIGTTTPTTPLAVNGNIQGAQFVDYNNTNYYLDPAATGNSLVINGNAAIGTTTTTAKTEIANSNQTTTDLLKLTPPDPQVNSNTGLLASGKVINAASTNHTYMTLDNKELTIGGHKNQISSITNVQKVFVYDTTKDTDGGRWTSDERAQAASWYNEARTASSSCVIGTSTRCGQQGFPKKAILVLASSVLYIFDAKDNSLWMAFNAGTTNMLVYSTTPTYKGLTALNGKIYLANGETNGYLTIVDFLHDSGKFIVDTNAGGSTQYTYNSTIANRNASSGHTGLRNIMLIGRTVNDVAAQIVNGKTYIAVATDQGTTLVNETDQTTADFQRNSDIADDIRSKYVAFLPNGDLYITTTDVTTPAGNQFVGVYYNAPAKSSETSWAQYRNGFYQVMQAGGWSVGGPNILGASNADVITAISATRGTSTIDGKSNTLYIGTSAGMTVLQEKQGAETSGSVKYYTSSYISEEMPGDIRGMWPMYETSGSTVADVSVKANNGTATGTTIVSGVRGKARSFNGSSDYVNVPTVTSPMTGQTARTISAWINMSNTNPGGTIFSINDTTATNQSYIFQLINSGGVEYLFTDGKNGNNNITISGSQIPSTGSWHHVALVFDGGSTYSYYLDGVLAKSGTFGTTINTTSTNLTYTIGKRNDGANAGAFFPGSMDDVTLTATTLSASQIKHMYEVGNRALQNHTSKTIRSGTVGADSQQVLGGNTSNVTSVAPSLDNGQIYVGTSGTGGGVSTVGMTSDTLNDLYTNTTGLTGISIPDDTNATSQWSTNQSYVNSLSVSKGYGTGVVLAAGQNNAGSGGVWLESSDTSFKDFLASSYNPFGASLTQTNLNVDGVFQVINQLSSRIDNLALGGTTSPSLSSPSLIVNSAGNVGIGTANPLATLHIYTPGGSTKAGIRLETATGQYGFISSIGNLHMTQNTAYDSTNGWTALTTGTAGGFQTNITGGEALRVFADNTSRAAGAANTFTPLMVVLTSGNVGIGTTGPTHKLHLVSGSTQDGAILDAVTYPELRFDRGGITKGYLSIAGSAGGYFSGSAADTLVIRSDAGPIMLGYQGSQFMTVATSGNVGIGTTAPAIPLEVRRDGNAATWYSRVSASNATSDRQVFLGNYGGIAGIFAHNYALNAWAPLYLNNVDGNTGMVIQGAGNVGIGTASPGYKLDVQGALNVGASGSMYMNGTLTRDAGGGWTRTYGQTGWYNGTYSGGWYMADTTYIRGYASKTVYNDASGNGLNGIWGYTAGSSIAGIYGQNGGSGSGVYGVTSSACCTGAGVWGSSGPNTSYDFKGDGGEYGRAGVWTNASSRALKTNFTYVDPQAILAKINELPVLQWNYKVDKPSVTHLGPIAEDFYALFHLGNDSSSISTIDPAGIALLGIQALSSQMATQSALTSNITLTDTGDLALVSASDAATLASNSATSSASATGSASLTASPSASTSASPYVAVNTKTGSILTSVIGAGKALITEIQTGVLKAGQISADSVSVGGETLHSYITRIVTDLISNSQFLISNQTSIFNAQKIVSPIAQVDQIHTNLISPLSARSDISVSLDNSQFAIRNSQSATGSAVATIDNKGNANFAGDLTARSASLSGNLNAQNVYTEGINARSASFSGTLHAGKIIADQIVGLGKYLNQNTSSNTAALTASASALTQANAAITASSLQTDFAQIKSLNATTATFSQGLIALGATTLSDTAVAGQLSVNANLFLADNTINTLSAPLEIQPLKQANVSFMAGLVVIDTDGNLTVNGNALFAQNVTVKGTLAAGILSPVPGSDLIIKLPENSHPELDSGSQFIIQNSSGSGVLTVNQKGDLTASGEAHFQKLNLSIAKDALAVSQTEIIATGSAGFAAIEPNQTEITIKTPLVTKKSLIYITPVGQPGNQPPYLMRQTEGASFTVGRQLPLPQKTSFNWLIVN